jgi:hypothetical protein
MPRCSVCGSETSLLLNGVPICPDCDKAIVGKKARSFAEVSEALALARQEYREAVADHSRADFLLGSLDPGNPAAMEAVCNTYARLEVASRAYGKALGEYRASLRQGQSCVARAAG